ncbi:hypothetical protein BD309DRAFT_955423 [Dichomitus squalens]|nr:hypothetical protein BD309DRAFT_955423 [Dichomitus squalens]
MLVLLRGKSALSKYSVINMALMSGCPDTNETSVRRADSAGQHHEVYRRATTWGVVDHKPMDASSFIAQPVPCDGSTKKVKIPV